jgi:hypothetical protein
LAYAEEHYETTNYHARNKLTESGCYRNDEQAN